MVLVGCSSIYVSVYYPKPASNLCNLFCDEFSYFMQFVCLLCTLTAKPFVVCWCCCCCCYLFVYMYISMHFGYKIMISTIQEGEQKLHSSQKSQMKSNKYNRFYGAFKFTDLCEHLFDLIVCRRINLVWKIAKLFINLIQFEVFKSIRDEYQKLALFINVQTVSNIRLKAQLNHLCLLFKPIKRMNKRKEN